MPLYYLSKFFQNREELHKLRHLELSITNEAQRVQLGSFLQGQELKDYEPEIYEAEERKAELEEDRKARRALEAKRRHGVEMRIGQTAPEFAPHLDPVSGSGGAASASASGSGAAAAAGGARSSAPG